MAKAKRVEAAVRTSDTEADRLYGVAMLKMALELRKPGAGSLDEVISTVLSRMRLDEDRFRKYLAANGGLLRAIAERRV